MKELMLDDLRFVLSRTPRDIRKLLQEAKLFLAGGFIRANIAGEKPSDIDLLGTDALVLENFALKLTNERKGRSHKTDNAITVIAPPRIPVQFILRWVYDDPDKLVHEFDFTIVQACIWWEPDKDNPKDPITDKPKGTWKSLCADQFYSDLSARRLRYTSPKRNEDAGGSLLRVVKYIKRGYTIQAPSIAAVIARLIGALNIERLEGQEGSTERRPFRNAHGMEDGTGEFIREAWSTPLLLALLREVDPLLVIDGMDFIDEHQVLESDDEITRETQ